MEDAQAEATVSVGGGTLTTVVYLYLSRYSAISRSLELGHKLGVQATKILDEQILALVRQAADDTALDFGQAFIKSTGDGAVLAFATPADAERFAVALQERAHEHRRQAFNDMEYRCFRVGIYTGEVLRTDDEVAGVAIAFAARLQAAAKTGQILIDADSWSRLPLGQQRLYGDVETVPGKVHDPTFQIHRRQVVPSAPWDTENQATQKSSPQPRVNIIANRTVVARGSQPGTQVPHRLSRKLAPRSLLHVSDLARKWLGPTMLFIAVVLVVTAIVDFDTTDDMSPPKTRHEDKQTRSKQMPTLYISNAIAYAPLHLADVNGYLPSWRMADNQHISREERRRRLASGDVEFFTGPLGEFVIDIAQQSLFDIPPTLLLVVAYSEGSDAVVARSPELGLADVVHEGVVTAAWSGGTGHYLLLYRLAEAAIDPDQMQFTRADSTPDLIDGLFNGKYDIVATWSPWTEVAVAQGAHVITRGGGRYGAPQKYSCILATRREHVQMYEEELKELFAAWDASVRQLREQPDATARVLAPWLELDKDQALATMETIRFLTVSESLASGPYRDLLNQVQEEVRFAGLSRSGYSPNLTIDASAASRFVADNQAHSGDYDEQ